MAPEHKTREPNESVPFPPEARLFVSQGHYRLD
jgi:hypothetical protein